MNVAQRSASETGLGASAGYFTLDRFRISPTSTAGRLTMEQVAVTDLSGFANCLKFTTTTADTSIASGEKLILQTKFEGQDLQQLQKGTSTANKFTLSFYVKGNAAAIYSVEIKDTDNNRSNTQSFAVTTSWNRIELTFAGDTTGVLDDDNAESISVNIWLHGGSDFTSGTYASNTWATTTNANRYAVASRTSIFDSTDRTFFITGLQMEVGSVATPFEHRSFGEELALCQRYYWHTYSYGSPAGTTFNQDYEAPIIIIGTGNHGMGVCNGVYPVEMRAVPTISFYGSDGTANRIRYWNSGSLAAYGTVNRSTRQILGMSFNAGTDPEDFYSAALVCDAEL
tara:strand:- start:207 stop:1229 length:1023 start_codon:yes stop_codon:yes gene_type:complete